MFTRAQTNGRLIPKKGLHVTTHQLTWITGSDINFLTPSKKNHHYFFTWWDQDIDSSNKNHDLLFIGSKNTAVDGIYELTQQDKKINTHFKCNWNLSEEAVADIAYAKLWLPFLDEAIWESKATTYQLNALGTFNDTVLYITTPFGKFKFSSPEPFKIKQISHSVPQKKDFDKRDQYLVFYLNDIQINKASGLNKSFCIEDISSSKYFQNLVSNKVRLEPVKSIWVPGSNNEEVLPKPKYAVLEQENYIIPPQKNAITNSVVAAYRKILKLDWQINDGYYPLIHTKQKTSLHKEGYTLSIDKKRISIEYATNLGLHHAIYTLAQLTKLENEQLVLPCGVIKDEPSVEWRGIHMFTGPTSFALHKKMYERVLLPLKMNKVVLQCEQAKWKAFPEVHNPISISLKDLKTEFSYLRSHDVEPIPLIQSLGHMEWFFKPKQNRVMAVNPQYPYTLNPTLATSRKAILKLWNEAFMLLKPSTIHIGFDEIGMIGFNQPKEREVDYWIVQMKLMDSLVKSKKATLMIWGDMGLAPNEGPDACNGITTERAATLRKTIPVGTLIGDWHYLSNANPAVYQKNLQIWKANKNFPVASPWLHPNNVRGFVHAAIREKAGVLQTTWADFESSEKNMLQNIEQFGAYVLAMDYAWSGREELPQNLPYDATKVWINKLYSQSKPINSKDGWKILDTIRMQDISLITTLNLPVYRNLIFQQKTFIGGWKLKASTNHILQEGTEVATMKLYTNGKLVFEHILKYGVEVRAIKDLRPVYAFTNGQDEQEWFCFLQNKIAIDEIRIQNLHVASGLVIEGFYLLQ